MSNERIMRAWYTPAEILTLRKWLVASVIVNILLLTIDVLRGDDKNLALGIFACIILAILRNYLPELGHRTKRDVSLLLSALVVGLGIFRLISLEINMFNIWTQAWLIVPGFASLWWLSSKPVTVWTSRELSTSAIEFGLMRNYNLSKTHQKIASHIILIHFVIIT
ncbi:MAG: hypothetical protein QF479_06155, partial [Candidatus Poseidoniaceae archaeon]|nr:hypothetical protein [Candidatus Poseidoniaceae archaeon]